MNLSCLVCFVVNHEENELQFIKTNQHFQNAGGGPICLAVVIQYSTKSFTSFLFCISIFCLVLL